MRILNCPVSLTGDGLNTDNIISPAFNDSLVNMTIPLNTKTFPLQKEAMGTSLTAKKKMSIEGLGKK